MLSTQTIFFVVKEWDVILDIYNNDSAFLFLGFLVMRIAGDVEISNRLLPALNMRGKSKAVRSHLSVGKKPGHKDDSDIYLMICTKQDRNGTKYKVV